MDGLLDRGGAAQVDRVRQPGRGIAEDRPQQGSGAAEWFPAQDGFAGQFADGHAAAVPPAVTWPDDHHEVFLAPPRGLESGPVIPPLGDRNVDFPEGEAFQDIAVGAQVLADAVAAGVHVADGFDQWLQEVGADVGGGAHHQFGVAEQPYRPVAHVGQGAGVAREGLGARRGAAPGGATLDQAGPHLGFQPAHLLGDCALGDPESRRGGPEPARADHRQVGSYLCRVHARHRLPISLTTPSGRWPASACRTCAATASPMSWRAPATAEPRWGVNTVRG